MANDEEPMETQTVVMQSGRVELAEAPANALTLALATRASESEPALQLFGFFNIDAALAGRYHSILPGAVYVVLVERESGIVHTRDLVNDDDPPASYAPDAEPSITRADDPSLGSGMSESGHFTIDLVNHMGLPADPGIYDGFLWLEDILSDMASAAKPGESEPVRTATNAPTPLAAPIQIAFSGAGEALRLHAQVDDGWPVSVIAMAPAARRIGSGVFVSGTQTSALVTDLIVGLPPGERVLAVAVAGGVRSPMIDSAGPN